MGSSLTVSHLRHWPLVSLKKWIIVSLEQRQVAELVRKYVLVFSFCSMFSLSPRAMFSPVQTVAQALPPKNVKVFLSIKNLQCHAIGLFLLIKKNIYSFIIFLCKVAYLPVISSPELQNFELWADDQYQQCYRRNC